MRLYSAIAAGCLCMALFTCGPAPKHHGTQHNSPSLSSASARDSLASAHAVSHTPNIIHQPKSTTDNSPPNEDMARARKSATTAVSTARRKVLSIQRDKTLARNIAKSATTIARAMRSVGSCYRGVKRAVSPLGIELSGSAAHSAKQQLLENKRFRMVAHKATEHKLKRGDILVHTKSSSRPHGHIAVYLGDGLEASDNIRKLVSGRGYGGTFVFRPVTQVATDSQQSSGRS